MSRGRSSETAAVKLCFFLVQSGISVESAGGPTSPNRVLIDGVFFFELTRRECSSGTPDSVEIPFTGGRLPRPDLSRVFRSNRTSAIRSAIIRESIASSLRSLNTNFCWRFRRDEMELGNQPRSIDAPDLFEEDLAILLPYVCVSCGAEISVDSRGQNSNRFSGFLSRLVQAGHRKGSSTLCWQEPTAL